MEQRFPHQAKWRLRRKNNAARRSVNTLSDAWMQPLSLPQEWLRRSFKDPSLPFVIDLGTGDGSFIKSLAESSLGLSGESPDWSLVGGALNGTSRPHCNALGIEIQPHHVDECNESLAESRLDHVASCLAGHTTIDLDHILATLEADGCQVACVCIQFPDPHFKRRYAKRRILQPEVVNCLAEHLKAGSCVFVQSDIGDLCLDMELLLRRSACFSQITLELDDAVGEDIAVPNPQKHLLTLNPWGGVLTEREKYVQRCQGKHVFRALFSRNSLPFSPESAISASSLEVSEQLAEDHPDGGLGLDFLADDY